MSHRRYKPSDIRRKLQEARALKSQGATVAEVCRKIEVTRNTYYAWRRAYGDDGNHQATRIKTLEQENAQLKRLVADLSLDNAVLRETVAGTA